ncbi:MAG: hypothetical protein U0K14_02855, partial [Eggerthellaceae bacterium]|nr:hypothetical protein [Eggerthellaceae bacterium]
IDLLWAVCSARFHMNSAQRFAAEDQGNGRASGASAFRAPQRSSKPLFIAVVFSHRDEGDPRREVKD